MSEEDLSQLSDEALMEQFYEGNDPAFEVLYARYHCRFVALLRRLGCRQPEDVAQEVFLRVVNTREPGGHRFDTGLRFRPWAYMIVYNLRSTNYHRNRREATGLEQVSEPVQPPPQEGIVLTLELRRQLRAQIQALPQNHREAITLVYGEGLSGKEAAEALSVNEDTLNTWLHRGRRKLKSSLSELQETRQ